MIKWSFNNEKDEIVFLLKTLKKEHLETTLKKGQFCFSFPSIFHSPTNLNSAQQDLWDSYSFSSIRNLVIAPIISDNESEIKYGSIRKLADTAEMHELSAISKLNPLCSFRKVEKNDIIWAKNAFIFSLGDLVEKIKSEFGHDAFILIAFPEIFIDRISKQYSCFARSIHYGKLDKNFNKLIYESNFEQIKMFQKSAEYAWQKEYRIILSPRKGEGPQLIEIGSIEDIAIGGSIDDLKNGFIFSDSSEGLASFKKIN